MALSAVTSSLPTHPWPHCYSPASCLSSCHAALQCFHSRLSASSGRPRSNNVWCCRRIGVERGWNPPQKKKNLPLEPHVVFRHQVKWVTRVWTINVGQLKKKWMHSKSITWLKFFLSAGRNIAIPWERLHCGFDLQSSHLFDSSALRKYKNLQRYLRYLSPAWWGEKKTQPAGALRRLNTKNILNNPF